MGGGGVTENPHRWAMTRFAARRAGLLSDDEERRMAEHLASCEVCGPAWQVELAPAEDDPTPWRTDTHIPAGVLATWPRASRSLRGLERTMIREHLNRCETCRQDLELLGYSPSLDIVPALEWTKADVPAPERVRSEQPPNVIQVFKLAPRKRDWTRWAFGGWAAIASAAALLLIVNPPGSFDGGGDQGPPIGSPLSPTPAPPRLSVARAPVRLGSAVRGGEASDQVITIPSGTRVLPLALEPLDLPTSSAVEVMIRREGEPTAIQATVANGELESGRLLLTAGDHELLAGTYVVRVEGGPAPDAVLSAPLTVEYRFVLRISASEAKP